MNRAFGSVLAVLTLRKCSHCLHHWQELKVLHLYGSVQYVLTSFCINTISLPEKKKVTIIAFVYLFNSNKESLTS